MCGWCHCWQSQWQSQRQSQWKSTSVCASGKGGPHLAPACADLPGKPACPPTRRGSSTGRRFGCWGSGERQRQRSGGKPDAAGWLRAVFRLIPLAPSNGPVTTNSNISFNLTKFLCHQSKSARCATHCAGRKPRRSPATQLLANEMHFK